MLTEGVFAMSAGEDLVSESSLQDEKSAERPREARPEAVSSSTPAELLISRRRSVSS